MDDIKAHKKKKKTTNNNNKSFRTNIYLFIQAMVYTITYDPLDKNIFSIYCS